MISMQEGSASVEQETNAKAKNRATESKRSRKKNSAPREATGKHASEDDKKTHGFSRSAAETKNSEGKKLGWTAAIVLRYLSTMVRQHGSTVDGKKWVRINLDHIASQYAYIGRSTVDEAVLRLETFGACEIGNLNKHFNRPKFDRTRSYHVPRKWMDAAEKDIRYFDPGLAAEIGVAAAVIYYNFMHWITVSVENGFPQRVQLAPATIESLQAFDKSTIKRAIAKLRDEEMILPVDGKQCWYEKGPADWPGSKPDETGSKADKGGSNPDESGSNPDNDIYCSPFVELLKKSSKTEAAPRSENSSSCAGNTIPESTTRDQDLSQPSADAQDAVQTRNSFEPDCEQELGSSAPTDQTNRLPPIASLEELHNKNQFLAPRVDDLELLSPETATKLADTIQIVANSFLNRQEPGWLDQLYDDATKAELFEALYPRYHQFFAQVKISDTSPNFEVFYFGTFECVIEAFHYDRKAGCSHPISLLHRVTYWLHIALWGRAEDRRRQAIDEEFAERRREFANREERLEDEADLSPAEKTRVFKQGLYSRNKVGGIYFDQQLRTNEIKITKGALALIEELFESNPGSTPSDLLKVMDGCLGLHRKQPIPTRFRKGVKWHARMGFNLLLFARYLPAIIRQLGMTGSAFTKESDRDCAHSAKEQRTNAEEMEFAA